MKNWKINSWKNYPVKHIPEYPNKQELDSVLKKIKDFPAQISDAINDTKSVSINLDKIHRVVIMGMGGSAIAGLIMKDISPHLEIIVERNYFPNAIIDENTLLIICSYSGNTEESLSYYKHASSLTKNIFGITSGGKLLKLLKNDNHNHCVLPEGYPPRSILGYALTVLIKLLDEDELLELLNVELLQEYSDKFSLAADRGTLAAVRFRPRVQRLRRRRRPAGR